MGRSPTVTSKRPIGDRFLGVVVGALLTTIARVCTADEPPATLDRDTVVKLASSQAPGTLVAERRVEEARAASVGAGALAPTNPEVSGFVGPRWQHGATGTDYFVGLTWPVELSGAASKRREVAGERMRTAEADATLARQSAVAEALALWVLARSSEEAVTLTTARLEADRTLLHAVEVRRRAGAIGDGDVALAKAFEAQSLARAVAAAHTRDANVLRLQARVGLSPNAPVRVGGQLVPGDPKSLPILVSELRMQPAVVRSLRALRAAQTDAELQSRARWPVPRITASTGRDPDTYAHFGVELPLPIYQRNQTNAAVTAARVGTAEAESKNAFLVGEAELRAAYTEYEGARDAFHALDQASASVDDAEHLAVRGYELGQATLADLATTRREATTAREARLEALTALARARIALDILTGDWK